MPSLFKILSLLALTAVSGALASPQPALALRGMPADCTVTTGFELCSRHNTPRSSHDVPSRERVPSSLTNAERLTRHLPLKPPTRQASARRAVSSPAAAAPANRGYIQVLAVDASGNPTGVLGYISKTTYVKTQYRIASSLDDALLVGRSGDHDLLTLNSETPSPAFLGLVQGRDDTSSGLATGSFNYLYLASTEQTPPNSIPRNVGNSFSAVYRDSYPAESAVWTLDPKTHMLTAQWINVDGSRPPTISFSQGSAIYFTADLKAYHQRYPAPVQKIAFVYIPA
ncbi:hypothetical protein C8R44DRAFT_982481 [Mycena epipterygia]|nr:hypothetical protein C8R44DRAFT_982481 [Mycena epipterygia]